MTRARHFVFGVLLGAALFSGCATAPNVVLQPVQNPQRPTPDDAYMISKTTATPRLVYSVPPVYPKELRGSGVKGEAVIDLIVLTDGTVSDPLVFRATDIRFGEAAREAVRQWKFKAAQVNGRAVKCHEQIVVVFDLKN